MSEHSGVVTDERPICAGPVWSHWPDPECRSARPRSRVFWREGVEEGEALGDFARAGLGVVSATGAPFLVVVGRLMGALRPVVLGEEVAEDVQSFCEREGLLDYLRRAGDLVERGFPCVGASRVQVDRDPETGEEWVTVNLAVEGGGDLLERYDRYTRAWVAQVPWPQRSKIRLCFDVV